MAQGQPRTHSSIDHEFPPVNEITTPSLAEPASSSSGGRLDRFLRERLHAVLRKLRHGQVHLTDEHGELRTGTANQIDHGMITIRVLNMGFYRAVALRGSLGAAEAFMDGYWTCDDLVGLVRLLVRNRELLDGLETGSARIAGHVLRAWHALQRNTRGGSRRNIAAHYDLGNDFFRLFLSADLMYSAAVWTDDPADTLAAASDRKLDLICSKLSLGPQDRVIEIGSGWGALACYAARRFGCHVTTITISREQFNFVGQRIAAEGLEESVTVLLEDYRAIEGQFDKLMSVEMIEAVGAEYLETYFATVGRLLKPGGRALIQAITIEDHRYRQALRSVDFIKRHIFPGSFIPSIHALLTAKTRATDLALIHLEDFGNSYARTLRSWRQRFLSQLPAVRALGFDDRFARMWEFYFAYCEGGFLEASIGVAHLLMVKPAWGRVDR